MCKKAHFLPGLIGLASSATLIGDDVNTYKTAIRLEHFLSLNHRTEQRKSKKILYSGSRRLAAPSPPELSNQCPQLIDRGERGIFSGPLMFNSEALGQLAAGSHLPWPNVP